MKLRAYIGLWYALGLILSYQTVFAGTSRTNNKDSNQNNYGVYSHNTPPTAINDTFIFFTGCAPTFKGCITTNDYDPDGDPFEVYFALTPFNGCIEVDPDGNFRIDPPENFHGTITFEYVIIEQTEEKFKALAEVCIQVLPDCDCDNVTDLNDLDNDNDGIKDSDEGDGRIDSDNDLIPDNLDIDSDNDGITDNVEWQAENAYIPPLGRDINKNGWDDAYDEYIGGIYYTPEDTNFDGIPDMLDTDTDDDGINDFIEAFDLNNDGITDIELTFSDVDKDGLDDAFDNIRCWREACNSTGSISPLVDFNNNGVRDWRDFSNQYHESSNFIYPNPIVESFKIYDQKIPANSLVTLQFFTLDGKLLLQKQIHHSTYSIDVPELNNGIYILKIQSEAFNGTQKVVINKIK